MPWNTSDTVWTWVGFGEVWEGYKLQGPQTRHAIYVAARILTHFVEILDFLTYDTAVFFLQLWVNLYKKPYAAHPQH